MANQSNQARPLTTIAAFSIVIVMIIFASILLLLSRPQPVQIIVNPPIPTATPQPSDTPAPIMVYVTGAVNQPEITVSVPFGSRVSDVLAASGGVRDDADMTRVNLAAVVRDGDQIHVFSVSDSRVNNSPVPTHPGGKMIFINSATLEELDTLPGIGPTIAGRIITYRQANGPFRNLQDLDNVSGIGPAILEDLEGLISFE